MKTRLLSVLLLIVLLFVAIGAFTSYASAEKSDSPAANKQEGVLAEKLIGEEMPLDIVGVTVLPHVYSGALRQMGPADPTNGALIQIFVKNRNLDPESEETLLVPAEAYFNDTVPLSLINTGLWTWSDTPDQRPDWWESRMLPAQTMDVYTINVRDPKFWGNGESGSFRLGLADWNVGYMEEYVIPVRKPDLYVSRILFTSSDGSFTPDGANIFLQNNTQNDWTIQGVNVWVPAGYLGATHAWELGQAASAILPFSSDGKIAAKTLGGAKATFGPLPLAEVIVEIQVSNGKQTRSLYNTVRSFVSKFDIGAGWIYGSETDVQPLTSEPYLKTLSLFHLNTAHIPEVSGYTDTDLYSQYPLKLFWPLNDPKYSTDEWLPKVHGNEQLGEPQCAICPGHLTPQAVFERLRVFGKDRFPMTLTLSDEPTFRYYAGLADFPHFDAYRVIAPSVDDFSLYSDRWGGETIGWGAPLETIGDMMRTLNAVSAPKPVAVWSQAAHEGWTDDYGGRARKSPTPLEIRVQNFEALANGATSVYWFSLHGKGLVCFRDTLDEFRVEGREMSLLGDLLAQGAPYQWERKYADLDLSSIAGADYAVLFAIDLTYTPDLEQKVFVSNGPRAIEAKFPLPDYLKGDLSIFKVDASGIQDVNARVKGQTAIINDTIDITGVYIVTTNNGLRESLSNRYNELVAAEAALNFDPANNDADFQALVNGLGYESSEAAGCGDLNP